MKKTIGPLQNDVPNIVKELREAIIADKRPLYQIASIVGIPGPTVSTWVSGKKEPRIKYLVALASALGYEVVLRRKVGMKPIQKPS